MSCGGKAVAATYYKPRLAQAKDQRARAHKCTHARKTNVQNEQSKAGRLALRAMMANYTGKEKAKHTKNKIRATYIRYIIHN